MSWIKIETHTPDKPEIYAIAELLNITPDDAFGKCFRVWAWFDAHTTNGKTNGASVSPALINRVAGVSGFAEAIVSTGWMIAEANGLTISNFDAHNGETAKKRGLTAKRVANHTNNTNGKTNAPSVSDALAREEKRREERTTLSSDSWFIQFWETYPKKVSKSDALKAWNKIKPDDQLATLIVTAVNRVKVLPSWTKDNGQFIPNAATWLNGKRWEDEEAAKPSTTPAPFNLLEWNRKMGLIT